MSNNQMRQGDVFLKPATLPAGRGKKIKSVRGRLILARGEATGHHHSVRADVAELFDFGGKVVLVVSEPTTLDHTATMWQGERDTLEPLTQDEAMELFEGMPEHYADFQASFPSAKVVDA